uniref:Uncharacterized protein n=1 Tax=Panagrellus redivivus TaxID=6233 RepID=A0A7E4UVC7_PANRE
MNPSFELPAQIHESRLKTTRTDHPTPAMAACGSAIDDAIDCARCCQPTHAARPSRSRSHVRLRNLFTPFCDDSCCRILP